MEKKSISRHQLVSTVYGFLTVFTKGMLCTVYVWVAICLCKRLFRFQFTWESPSSYLYFKRESPQIQFTWVQENRLIISGGAKLCEILALAEADSMGLMAFSIPTALIFCSCKRYSYSSLWKLILIFFILCCTISITVLLCSPTSIFSSFASQSCKNM